MVDVSGKGVVIELYYTNLKDNGVPKLSRHARGDGRMLHLNAAGLFRLLTPGPIQDVTKQSRWIITRAFVSFISRKKNVIVSSWG